MENEIKNKKEEELMIKQYTLDTNEDEHYEKFSILSQTPGELLFVERLIFKEVCSIETLFQFGRMRTEFPLDKELRRMCM